jgi:hypothetical protein
MGMGDISDINMSKINAVKTLHLVDTFWERWEVFNWCTMALNGIFPDFEVMQVPTISQCLISCDIARRLRMDVDWSSEVKEFVSAVFRTDGVVCAFEPCDFISIDTEGLPVDCAEVATLWSKVRVTGEAPTDETIVAEQLRRLLFVYKELKESRLLLRSQLKLVEYV